ncbi:hypothetical protein ACPOL_1657 [Acidisarcina polymorpha]|uniref:Uncharacterized protein n=1 Tax=Acidisarcina polymorpha TaxID=2211140 RepID=A0A2Z5FVT6_9BACT|nr:hypothetical protein ACPOL_1657 [Acidisarcina polymorpha]
MHKVVQSIRGGDAAWWGMLWVSILFGGGLSIGCDRMPSGNAECY